MGKIERKEIKRQIKLPLIEAVKISFRNVQMRIGRSVITTSGTFLGIAFLASILTNETIMTALNLTEGTVKTKQIWLLVMSLLVCALGIVNAMLMAVIERYREIGTMKCLGALDGFIVELFLLESGFLGLIGSFSGAIAGSGLMILADLMKYKSELMLHFPWLSIIKYIGFSTVLGTVLSLICAAYPAYRAAKMEPAIAMRTEV